MGTALSASELRARKGGRRIAMLTAYDYPTALALDQGGLDILLVGDSLGEVELGYDTTRAVSLGMMTHHLRAVRNGVERTHVCADMPAGTYRTPEEAVASARELVAAGADSVKLEGGLVEQVAAIIADGIPVMGHVGLLPQTADRLPAPGDDARRGRPHRRRGARPRRRRLLRGGDRGRAGRARRAHHRRGRLPDDRHRGRAGVRRPGARSPPTSSARCRTRRAS